MQFAVTEDAALVRAILTHPKIWESNTDDSAPPWQEMEVKLHPGIRAITVHDGTEFLGLFVFEVRNMTEWMVHTMLLPSVWGPRAVIAAKEMAQWIWDNTTCRRITTHVPAYNRLALRFARRAGMSEYGFNPLSWSKGGVLYGQHELGISKEQ